MPRRAWAVVAALVSPLLALVFARVSLDWSDAQPYDPAVTEPRYILFILISAAIALTGPAVAVLLWWSARAARRKGRPDADVDR